MKKVRAYKKKECNVAVSKIGCLHWEPFNKALEPRWLCSQRAKRPELFSFSTLKTSAHADATTIKGDFGECESF